MYAMLRRPCACARCEETDEKRAKNKTQFFYANFIIIHRRANRSEDILDQVFAQRQLRPALLPARL